MEGPAAVSDSLVYTPRPSAITGSKIRQNIQCYNLPVAGPGRVIMFNIPCGRRGQFLSPRASYFKFRLTNTGSANFVLDYSAHAFISRLELYHGSNLLEQISEYHVLAHLLKDMQVGADNQLTVGSALEGTATARTGEQIIAAATGPPVVQAGTRVFSIQLLSGLIGGLQEKYIPVGELAGDLRLELTLANQNEPVVGTSIGWSIDQMELMLEYVELSDTATAMVNQQNPGGFMMSFDSFANYSSTIGAGNNNTSINVLIPARYSVLKTLLTSIRADANRVAANKSITARENRFGDTGEWYFSIGGKNNPATPVKSSTEAYAEMLKAQHALGSVSAPTMLSRDGWIVTTAGQTGTYIVATDLEYLHGKSSRASNGVNTLSVNTHLVGRLLGGSADTHTIDTFAHYEGVLMIVNGIAQAQI